jgi:hypothetical protein
MAQGVSLRPLAAKAQVRYQINPCEICGGQSGTGTGLSASNSSTRCSFQKDKRAKPGNLPKSKAVSEIGEHWTEKDLHFLGL